MQPPIGRLGTKAAPGGNATQLKKGKLEMGIREDFLAGRTAGLEKDPPRGRAGSSLTRDTGNQTARQSGRAEGGKPVRSEDEPDNPRGLPFLEFL